ncbi:MAG: low temperature requirement protein A [Acidimicrobiales bacterium]
MRVAQQGRRRPAVERRRVHDWEESRHATWLELFYDLVFVVAVARLALLLHDDHDLGGLLTFFALFVPIWWAWISFSYFADLFDEDRPLDRIAQLAAMLGAAVVAVALSSGVSDDSTVVAAAFAAMFTLLAVLYAHAGRTEPAARELIRWYVAGSTAGASLWAASIVTPTPARYWLWGLAVVVNAMLSGPVAYARTTAPPQQVSHMPERFGLFALVVLGESVLAVVNGIDAATWGMASVVTAVAGFVIAASIWWVYFGAFDEHAIDRALASGRYAQVRSFLYGYGHLAVYAAIAATGVGVELAIEEAGHDGEPVMLLAVALTLVMVGLTIMASGVGSQGPGYVMATKAVVPPLGIVATLAFDDAAVATVVIAVCWAVLAAVKWHAAGSVQSPESSRTAPT